MSNFPQTVSVRTLFIVSVAVFSVTSLSWYLTTNRRNKKAIKTGNKNDIDDVKEDDIDEDDDEKASNHHTRYSTRQILSHKLRSYSTFLEAIRCGDISSAVEYGSWNDIVKFLPIITAILANVPFGCEMFRNELLNIFLKKCDSNKFLKQSFHFFLYAYFNQNYVQKIWNKHPIYKYILKNDINLIIDDDKNDKKRKVTHSKRPQINTLTLNKNQLKIRYERHKRILNEIQNDNNNGFRVPKHLKIAIKQNKNNKKNIKINHVEYFGKNVVELFEIFTFNPSIDDIKNDNKNKDDNNISIDISAGFKVDIISSDLFCDPIKSSLNLKTIQIQSIFKSNAQPLLLNLYLNNAKLSSQIIFKKGDDLRKDHSVLSMFHLFNDIFRENGLKYNGIYVSTYCYKCIPMSEDFGCIEYINNCIPLTDISTYYNKNSDSDKLNKLISTSIGSYISSYIMGIRDRHSDNILINRDDSTLFHIDFGYVLGEKLSGLDASKFAITTDLQNIMGIKHWNNFIIHSLKAFNLLRKHSSDILSFAKTAIRFLEWNKIELFLKKQLMIGANDNHVEKYIKDKIKKSPNKWKTKMKNTIHSIAMNVKK